MIKFRPCPSFPRFEASQCGIIRRVQTEAVGKSNSTRTLRARIIMQRLDRYGELIVAIGRSTSRVDRMVADAWENISDDRPLPTYRDGRVVTVAEWMAERSACR